MLTFCICQIPIRSTESIQDISSREGVKLGNSVSRCLVGLEEQDRTLRSGPTGSSCRPGRRKTTAFGRPHHCYSGARSPALDLPSLLEENLASPFLSLPNLTLVPPAGRINQNPASKSPASRPLKYRREYRWSDKRLDTNK